MKIRGFLLLFFFFSFASFAHAQTVSVDLLWKGTGYTPAFYKGKDLWAKQGQIVFTAIPHGFSNPASLIYKWRRNGEVLGSASGVGKSSLTLADSILSKPITIAIEIVDSDDMILAERSEALKPTPVKLLIYEDNPLYGLMLHHETGASFLLREKEVSFSAAPLFYSAGSRNSPLLRYAWNTSGAGADQATNRVTFRIPEGSGTANIFVNAKNSNKLLQSAEAFFAVQFGSQSTI